MRSTIKGKNLLRWKQSLFLEELTPNKMGSNNENYRAASPEGVPIHLNKQLS